jgi:hypothetical protein
MMPRVKTTAPTPTREKGQRSLQLEDYLQRILPQWRTPEWMLADAWRSAVANQPIATVCRDTLIANLIAMDWKIEAVDSTKRDEYKDEIDYYEDFFRNTGDYDYVEIIEWVVKDALDIPFGGACEVGREGDNPNGRLLWIELLDGGTLFPTLNKDWPVGQSLKESLNKAVFFPAHAINRIYLSPRTDIKRKGWGMPPPQKIYLALEMINRGDIYYANLLLDTPEAGILDLLDMSKDSATEWLQAWKSMLGGLDPFKIPVLYEHEKPAIFIPFNRPPTEMMYDKTTEKYASIVTAGYGMSLSDIGFQSVTSGGDTLAGSIRQERRTRRTGHALLKNKVISFFNRLLPPHLRFVFIDLDDELNVAIGRARLASATASQMLVDQRIFLPNEMRQQMIADGLISISIPETIPEGDEFPEESQQIQNRPEALGKPVSPSQGGHGEIRSDAFSKALDKITDAEDYRLRRLARAVFPAIASEVRYTLGELDDPLLESWNEWHDLVIYDGITEDIPELTLTAIGTARSSLSEMMNSDEDKWWLLDFDNTVLLEEMKSTLREIHNSMVEQAAIAAYERGEIHSLEEEFELDTEYKLALEGRFENAFIEYIEEKMAQVPIDVQNSVITAVRRYLTRPENSNKLIEGLDTDTFIRDNSLMENIRGTLKDMKDRLIYETASNVSRIIKGLLEE